MRCKGFRLDDTMEGEVIWDSVQKSAEDDRPLHSLTRIYTSNASSEDLIAALEQEAGDVIRSFAALLPPDPPGRAFETCLGK